MTLLLVITNLFFFLSTAANSEFVVHEQRDRLLGDKLVRQRVKGEVSLPMRIALQPNEHAITHGEAWLRAVSDPESSTFGQFWSDDEIVEAFKPAEETVKTVKDWLSVHGIADITHSDNKQWLAFDLPARQAEALLKTKYYERILDNGGLEISCDDYMLPRELQAYVDFVKPGVKSSSMSKRSRHQQSKREVSEQHNKRRSTPPPTNPNSLEHCDLAASPACIRALYNFSALGQTETVSANNSMGIFEEDDLYYQGDLDKFYEHLTDIPNGTTPIDLSIDGGAPPPTAPHALGWKNVYGESNLDLMSALPIIYPQNATIYQTDDRYTAHQVGYNYHGLDLFNDFLDAIDGSYCTYSAFGETGNDPKHDPTYPDPHPGGYKGKLQCGVFKPTNVISISYGAGELGLPFYYQKRQCSEFMKLALRGVSVFVASGDSGSDCSKEPNRLLFETDQLVGCPWVTSVGATQIAKGDTVDDPEGAAMEGWAGISSGGGFSILFEAPWYQTQTGALTHYFKVSNNASDLPYFTDGKYKGNDGVYNRNGRGVPDLSAIGSNIAVWTKNQYQTASGTSASAPIVAALFNRIIEERIRAGKRGPLGLVNPTLYKNPGLLNDVTKGNNGECTVPRFRLKFGAQYGYNCTEGWDPVTGLGTPKYPEMLKVFMDLP